MINTHQIAAFVLAAMPALALAAPTVSGDYLEARTADVYTGPCFANAEMNLAGKEAILAWRVEEGEVAGVELAGLSVVAVIETDATLGDPYAAQPLRPRAVVFVDQRAAPPQRAALLWLARDLGGELLQAVEAAEPAPIDLAFAGHGEAALRVGGQAALRTRGLHNGDHLCGNEDVFYPPLAPAHHAHPAVTLEHRYSGSALSGTWSSPGKRSAFVGRFSR